MSQDNLTQQPSSAAKDFFAYLLLFVLLYTWVTSLGRLLFGFINVAFPLAVPGLPDHSVLFEQESRVLKLQFSILLVSFPVFLLLARWINSQLASGAMRWESRVRKWLTYLTLFVAAVTVIIDVATLLYYLLSGDYTVRFFLKVLTVFLLGGGAFHYYLRDARDPQENTEKCSRPFAKWISVAIVLSLLSTFFVVDPPWVERAKRFDRQRVNDLGSITYAVQAFYEQRGVLPTQLGELQNQGPWYVSSLVDPQTSSPYEYTVKGATDYELCATFSREGSDTTQPGVYPLAKPYPIEVPPKEFISDAEMQQLEQQGLAYPATSTSSQFLHSVGRTCFGRKVYQRVK